MSVDRPSPDLSTAPPRPTDGRPTRANLRERWRTEVLRTSLIGDAAKLLLLALHEDMDHRGYVSVGRPVLACRIGRSERRVSERMSEAVKADFLAHIVRGQKGVTPVYRAMLPDSLSGTVHSPLTVQRDDLQRAERSPDRPAETVFSGTPGGPTSSRRHHSFEAGAQQEPGGLSSERDRLDDVQDVDPAQHLSAADLEAIARARLIWGMTG